MRRHHTLTLTAQSRYSRPRPHTQTCPPLACSRRPSAATTGHPGRSPPRAPSHTRCTQPRNDSIKRAASTSTTPTAQTTEDTLSIRHSQCTPTLLSPATSLLNTSFPHRQWTIWSALLQTRHLQAQQSATPHATGLIARLSTHSPRLRRQHAQPPPLQTRTASWPYISVPSQGTHSPSTAVPCPRFRGDKRTPPHPPSGARMTQRRMAARRHCALAAPSQALSPTPTPPLFHYQPTMQPSHLHTTINTIPWTHWVIKNANCPVPAPQTTQWLMRPCPCLPPWRSTSLRPLDCARSEGECRRSGGRATWSTE